MLNFKLFQAVSTHARTQFDKLNIQVCAYFDETDVSPGLDLESDKLSSRVRAYVSERHSTQQALLVQSEQQREVAVAITLPSHSPSIYLTTLSNN